jgi:hypothetical protein
MRNNEVWNFPLSVRFVTGSGELNDAPTADANGIASCDVSVTRRSLTSVNYIYAGLAFDRFAKIEPDFAAGRVRFTYNLPTKETTRICVDLNETHNGQDGGSVVSDAIREALTAAGFKCVNRETYENERQLPGKFYILIQGEVNARATSQAHNGRTQMARVSLTINVTDDQDGKTIKALDYPDAAVGAAPMDGSQGEPRVAASSRAIRELFKSGKEHPFVGETVVAVEAIFAPPAK